MRVALIGTIDFSRVLMEKLLSLNTPIVGVVSRSESRVNSDFCDLTECAEKNGIKYLYDKNVNSIECIGWLSALDLDWIFCFGWPQLLSNSVLSIARVGCMGYHPAELPKNRGRHPIIWALALGLQDTASTFFIMKEGADDGDIVSQVKVDIEPNDDAEILYLKLQKTACEQLETLIPRLKSGNFERYRQDPGIGNVWRKRSVADGKIDWRMSANSIHNLVRSLSRPYPGAHFVFKGNDIKLWKSKVVPNEWMHLEPGKILKGGTKGAVIKCGDQSLELSEVELDEVMNAGEYL